MGPTGEPPSAYRRPLAGMGLASLFCFLITEILRSFPMQLCGRPHHPAVDHPPISAKPTVFYAIIPHIESKKEQLNLPFTVRANFN